jgi:hypothetical protein
LAVKSEGATYGYDSDSQPKGLSRFAGRHVPNFHELQLPASPAGKQHESELGYSDYWSKPVADCDTTMAHRISGKHADAGRKR